MGSVIHRPLYSVDYGQVETVGGGAVLGDADDATFKRYFEDAGSIQVYPDFTGVGVPAGREIIAVRNCHRQRNTGFAGLYNGWVMSFLRISNKRQNVTKTYVQDGYNDGAREIKGPPLYKNAAFDPWTNAEITTMASEVGAATGDIGPSSNRWCVCSESYIRAVYDEPVPVPTLPYPANGQTISTSSVSFTAQHPAPQEEQPVRTIFQVSRVPTFDNGTEKTFIGGLNALTTGSSRSNYISEVGKDSYTDLGPGLWYLRMKGRDFRGSDFESAWGATTTFTITHGALTVPSLTSPTPGATSPTPYGTRSAIFTSQPSGERKVGAGWRFSKDPTFATGVVSWQNRTGGFYFATADNPSTVSYNAQPNPDTLPGLDGGTVSFEDPIQYLSQGTWYAQVRAVDIYGQVGAWSSSFTFTVAHNPVVAAMNPSLGVAFDKDTDPVTWKFTDPWNGDTQSAYRMKVYDASMNLIQDTGKILSSVAQATMVIPNTYKEQNLSYKLTIWDADDAPSTEATATFKLSTAPIVTVPFPAVDEGIITGQPTITWSVVFATGSITQKSYRIRFLERATGAVAYDTGTIVSTATSWTAPRAILKNLLNYQLQVIIVDSQDLDGIKTVNFSTNFIRPDGFFTEVDGTDYQNFGYVNVRWPDALPDGFFAYWRIYRRKVGETDWTFVAELEDVSARSYQDWYVSGDSQFQYTVTQVAYRFGSLVESVFDENSSPVRVYSDSYWILDPSDNSNNIKISSVNADKFTTDQETTAYVIIGRGRKVNYGTYLGREGSLTVQVRDRIGMPGSEVIRRVQNLFRLQTWVYLRDPFGGLTKVSIPNTDFNRMPGVGNAEYGELNIPYTEVGAAVNE